MRSRQRGEWQVPQYPGEPIEKAEEHCAGPNPDGSCSLEQGGCGVTSGVRFIRAG